MIKKINYLEGYYNSTIFYNGFEQKKIKKKYFLRAKNPKRFLKILGLNFKRIEPNKNNFFILLPLSFIVIYSS